MQKTSTGTWLITGAATGFGYAIASTVLARGGNVVATARNPQALQPLLNGAPQRVAVAPLDVTQPQQIADAVAAAEARFGAIDVLVNNAGYGLIGSVEETDPTQMRRLFEVNFFGLSAMTRAVLPAMRVRRQGWIVNISSVAGLAGFAGSAYYAASKFAVEGYSEALRQEVQPLGIGVMVVEPGFFKTEFGNRVIFERGVLADYADTAGATAAHMASMLGREPGDPQRAAAAIVDAVDSGHAPAQLVLGAGAIEMLDRKLSGQRTAMLEWRDVARGADFPV